MPVKKLSCLRPIFALFAVAGVTATPSVSRAEQLMLDKPTSITGVVGLSSYNTEDGVSQYYSFTPQPQFSLVAGGDGLFPLPKNTKNFQFVDMNHGTDKEVDIKKMLNQLCTAEGTVSTPDNGNQAPVLQFDITAVKECHPLDQELQKIRGFNTAPSP